MRTAGKVGLGAAAIAIVAVALFGVQQFLVTTPEPPPGDRERDDMAAITKEEAEKRAHGFIRNTSTFQFDGLEGSIETQSLLREEGNFIFTIKYTTAHPGHGNREGLVLAQVLTDHLATIEILEDGTVVNATSDNEYNLLEDRPL